VSAPPVAAQGCHWARQFFAGGMSTCIFRPLAVTGAVLLLAGCATSSTDSAEAPTPASARPAAAEARSEAPRETVTATEAAVQRRAASSAGREGGGNTPADMAKLVEQLNDAARELATLRTANAKLRAEQERPRPSPAPEPAAKADPADERLAASLKSFAQFKQEMTNLLSEVERLKKANAGSSAEVKTAAEQARQARAALTRVEEDLRAEKKLRQEAEASAGQLREQLRTIARAMTDVGLSAEKLTAQTESGGTRGRTAARAPAEYVVREGDTLLKIADRMYGDPEKWRVIMEANRGRVGTDGAIEVGVKLQIPRN
jgi:nucleoid-associated protein YgaU